MNRAFRFLLGSTVMGWGALAHAQESVVEAAAASSSGITAAWGIAPFGALFGLVFAWICYRLMVAAPRGNARMEEIAGYVREGAMAYLKQQYSRVGIVFAVLFVSLPMLAQIVSRLRRPTPPVGTAA